MKERERLYVCVCEREREREASYLHVVEDEEESFNGQPLEKLKRVKVSWRVLMVVVGRRIGISLKVRSKYKKIVKVKTSSPKYMH